MPEIPWPEYYKVKYGEALERERVLLERIAKAEAECAEMKQEIERGPGRRKHTCDWYAEHYGKLHDWARNVLPEPYRNQFFSCIANGLYDAIKDVGKPYKVVAGFMVTPGGYFKMDTAQNQILFDQCVRAEDAESELATLRQRVEEMGRAVTNREWEIADGQMRQKVSFPHPFEIATELIAARARKGEGA